MFQDSINLKISGREGAKVRPTLPIIEFCPSRGKDRGRVRDAIGLAVVVSRKVWTWASRNASQRTNFRQQSHICLCTNDRLPIEMFNASGSIEHFLSWANFQMFIRRSDLDALAKKKLTSRNNQVRRTGNTGWTDPCGSFLVAGEALRPDQPRTSRTTS